MATDDLLVLLPLIITGYGAIVVLVVGVFWQNHVALVSLALTTFAAAFLSVFVALPLVPRQITPLFRVDAFALYYMGLFLLGGFAVAVLSHDYLERERARTEKYYGLLLLAIFGALALVASSHFASFFGGLETLSVALYSLIGYTLRRPASLEASMKYLVLAGAALAFLLFGMALIYADFGTMSFGALSARWQDGLADPFALAPLGLALVLVGFGFKLAAVPFHTWAPDVYQGAPAPVSALVATVSKAAMFALLLRFAVVSGLQSRASTFLVLEGLAIVTMFGGNLLALFQSNIKRLLAYSSVAHMGYLLVPLLTGDKQGVASIGFYFVAYFITTIGAFGVVSAISAGGPEREDLKDYRGLGLQRPWLGAVLAFMMLSLAGIPLTVGFMAKLYIFSAAAHSRLWLLLVLGVVNSGLAAYYYLRVLATLYSVGEAPQQAGEPAADLVLPSVRPGSALLLACATALALLFGLYPGPLIWLAQQSATLLVPLR